MTFKTCIVGAFASVLAASAVSAADLPIYKAPPPPPRPVFSWEGFHIGISGSYAGGVSSQYSQTYVLSPGPLLAIPTSSSVGTSGYLVGYQNGYNWVFANGLVAGYESEFNYADVRPTNTGVYYGGANAGSRLQWFGMERLRFGYAYGRFLPYITGGLAYGKVRPYGQQWGGIFPTNQSVWQGGFAIGAGIEYAVLDNWTIKAEYIFTRMKGATSANVVYPFYRTASGNYLDTNIARIGVNYQVKNIGALIGMPELGL
ncbi:outer membrane protein [Methylocystis sp. SC2]|uniref:outer membrane protein n=1 Tax=Methylocystis sp. (strain SC2) TaxID=187303 RepID=UPI00027AE8F6|nr:outer membrane beta-barrel protein [Methylocystis sp. SC2]CCJ06142.1 Outer membrane protein Omp31 [Methylocystis sp. SC2]